MATLWTLAYGTRIEDAQDCGIPPPRLLQPPRGTVRGTRQLSVFRQGLAWLSYHLARGRLWTRLWLRPAAWPQSSADLHITYHDSS